MELKKVIASVKYAEFNNWIVKAPEVGRKIVIIRKRGVKVQNVTFGLGQRAPIADEISRGEVLWAYCDDLIYLIFSKYER